MRFDAFAKTFLKIAATERNSAGELRQKEMALRTHLIPHFGERELDEIGVPLIREFTAIKVADSLAPKTVNNLLGHLARLLHVAAMEGERTKPLPAIRRLPTNFAESRFLLPAEASALIAAAKSYSIEHSTPAVYAMIRVGLYTGLRVGEILALEWSDFSPKENRLHVRRSWCRIEEKAKEPKNGHHRSVSLSEPAMALLKNLQALSETKEGRIFPIRYMVAHRTLARIVTLAKLKNVGWHTLRHTFASWLVTSGVPLFTVSRMLGHQSVRVTERYSHLNDDSNKKAAAIITQILEQTK